MAGYEKRGAEGGMKGATYNSKSCSAASAGQRGHRTVMNPDVGGRRGSAVGMSGRGPGGSVTPKGNVK